MGSFHSFHFLFYFSFHFSFHFWKETEASTYCLLFPTFRIQSQNNTASNRVWRWWPGTLLLGSSTTAIWCSCSKGPSIQVHTKPYGVWRAHSEDIRTTTFLKWNGFNMLDKAIHFQTNRKCSAHTTTENAQENNCCFSYDNFCIWTFWGSWGCVCPWWHCWKTTAFVNYMMLYVIGKSYNHLHTGMYDNPSLLLFFFWIQSFL